MDPLRERHGRLLPLEGEPPGGALIRARGYLLDAAVVAAVLGVVLAAPPLALGAQEVAGGCDLSTFRTFNRQPVPGGPGLSITWVGGAELTCPDGGRIRADSIVSYSESGRNQLIGNVVYRDATRELRANEADQYTTQGQIFARGSVVLRELDTGREVRGDTVTLVEASAGREEQMTVRGRPAVAMLPELDSGTIPAATTGAYRIEASVLRFDGERFIWGDDAVRVERDSLLIESDSLAFDRDAGSLLFLGGARMEQDSARFEGERMLVRLADEVIQSVDLQGNGRVVNEDIELAAPSIAITVENDQVQRVLAIGHAMGTPDADLPHLVAEEFLVVGDTIEILSPNEVLDRVHAMGRAWGQTLVVGEALPAIGDRPSVRLTSGPLTGAALANDWIEADRINVLFGITRGGSSPVPGVDPGGEYFVSQLIGVGSARTLYRSRPTDAPPPAGGGGPPLPGQVRAASDPTVDRSAWPISYVTAGNITVFLAESGEVEDIQAIDDVVGIQLDPVGTRTP